MPVKTSTVDLQQHYDDRLARLWRRMPFVLRITAWQDLPVPVLVVKERYSANGTTNTPSPITFVTQGQASQGNLVERGHLAGEAQHRCLPIVRQLVGRVRDVYGIPLELHHYLTREGLKLRVNLPWMRKRAPSWGSSFASRSA